MPAQRAYEKVANRIYKLMQTGNYPPGSRLPGERELAEKFGVSRVTVRKAEIALQATGRIEIKVGSGAYVLKDDLPKASPFELTEARALFEAESAALAAPIITDEAIAELEKYIDIMSGRIVTDMSPDEAGEAFHITVARSTNNPVVMFVIDSMWKMRAETAGIQKIYKAVCAEDNSQREEEYSAILHALKKRDPSAARGAMRVHFTGMIEALLVASEQAAYQAVKEKASKSRSRFTLTEQLL